MCDCVGFCVYINCANMSFESLPKSLRGLRACLMCSLIKSTDQFEQDGCDNCEAFLKMKDNRDVVYDCTSQNFDGWVIQILKYLI